MVEWVCSHCELELGGDRPGIPCPGCGRVGRTTHLVIQETVEVRTSIGLKKDVPGLPRKKRTRMEHFQGWDLRKSLGDWIKKVRRIDRDEDTYLEHVEDSEGKVIHHREEPLSKHRGHGSAKQRR